MSSIRYTSIYLGHEDQKSIITVVVSLIVSNVKNYLIEQLLQQVLDELLPYSSL